MIQKIIKIAVILSFAFVGMNLNAQENGFVFRPLFAGGGGAAVFDGFGGYAIGGIGEFALLVYERDLQFGLHFGGRGNTITSSSGNRYGSGSLMSRISLGGFWPRDFLRSYSFIEGGIGFGAGNNTTAMNIIFGGGGGLDLFFNRHGSVYLEIGYLQHHINNELIGGISINIGTRRFFR